TAAGPPDGGIRPAPARAGPCALRIPLRVLPAHAWVGAVLSADAARPRRRLARRRACPAAARPDRAAASGGGGEPGAGRRHGARPARAGARARAAAVARGARAGRRPDRRPGDRERPPADARAPRGTVDR